MIFRSFCTRAFAAAGMLFTGAADAAGCNCGTTRDGRARTFKSGS